jgi:signal transduction histidine kinase
VFEDSGKGIPPAIIKRIFEPFFTTKFGKGGSGLGLSITFNIITNVLGGEIRVTSEPNQGARFEISLPLIAPGNQDVNEQIIGD